GKAQSFYSLARATFQAMGKPVRVKYIPMPVNLRDRYQYFTQADLVRLRKIGYKNEFSPLDDAVKDYVRNYLMKEDPYL
ncbi:MAG: ADP-L-glycero-D-mannoheptose-6-epimerase, partial [Spirochaetes bacterium]|nr:ADP-L-glycero-D-mannoheptose-6-epimerase [Spirochaetota bacterium]